MPVEPSAVISEADEFKRPWPDLLYRFVEHYKFEPGHLCIGDPIAVFHERIRRQEVPLNFMMALLLSWVSSDTVLEIIRPFGLDAGSFADTSLHLCYPIDAGYTQPDIHLASETARIFIELKWNATIDKEQVQKYLLLHAALDNKFGRKRPYLLFLTKRDFKDCWRPRAEATVSPFVLSEFLNEKSGAPAASNKVPKRERQTVMGRFPGVRQAVGYGAATWEMMARQLELIAAHLRMKEGRGAEEAAIRGFLIDLSRRLQPSQNGALDQP